MNNLQKIALDISGYSDYSKQGAKNDGYYEQKTLGQKLDFILEYAEYAEGVMPVKLKDAFKILSFLEGQNAETDEKFSGSNDRFHAIRHLR